MHAIILAAFAPIILKGPGSQNAIRETEARLSCQVFGSPTPTVSWSGAGFEASMTEEVPTDENGLALVIVKGVGKASQGEYTCFAENKYGQAEKTGHLTVRGKRRV